ncbi:MAG: high-potential iron-sulfur protein [Candidatus Eremiobacteraeota bacterium]|nr:high-potential iron-sulfur protein [Candidatus Eremiobacteraeota bacterium]
MNDNDKLASRAQALGRIAAAPLAIGALAALRAEAEAAATMDQKAAAYQTKPNGGKKCEDCSLFLPAKSNPMKANGAYTLVKGSISPNGWCKFFAPKAK